MNMGVWLIKMMMIVIIIIIIIIIIIVVVKHPSQWKKGGKVGKNCLDDELPF